MDINITEEGNFKLKHVYNTMVFETEEKEELLVCMRDGAFEIATKNVDGEYIWHIANKHGIQTMKEVVTIEGT